MGVRFAASKAQMTLIRKIVERARKEEMVRCRAKPNHWYTKATLTMDLDATVSNGSKLDLKTLLESSDFDFVHDIAGIARHIDRETGKLGDMFVPRAARS